MINIYIQYFPYVKLFCRRFIWVSLSWQVFLFQVGSNAGSRMGSRSRLGSQLGSQSKLSQGKSNLGSNMLLPGVMMNGGNKSSLQLNGLAGPKSKVAPMENPEVIIGVSSSNGFQILKFWFWINSSVMNLLPFEYQ